MLQTTNSAAPTCVLETARPKRRLAWWSAMGLCGLCSCTSLGKPQTVDPFQNEPARQETWTAPSAAGRARVSTTPAPQSRPTAIQRQWAQQPVQPQQPIQLASNEVPTQGVERAIERVAAEARTPAFCPQPFASGAVFDDQETSPVLYPDEYLFDGGDRGYPITRNIYQLEGLETEDTIAEFEDEEGRTKIKKSNRVAIYAPRFGSVVATSGPAYDTLVDKVQGHVASQGGTNLRNRTAINTEAQNLETGRMDTRLSPTGVGTDVAGSGLYRGQGRGVGVGVLNTHESRTKDVGMQFVEKEGLQLLQGMAFADTWTRKDNPVIQGHGVSATQSKTVQIQADFTGLEDNGKRGDLRLRKIADKGVAEVGEVVTFTIFFENRGDLELKNVSIIDNLTPRLDYLPEATKTDLPGKMIAEDNGEGSVVLRFALDGPLPGRTKGSIIFQARVK